MGSASEVRLELGVAIRKVVLERNGTNDDITLVLEKRPDVVARCADLILAAARATKDRLEFSLTVSSDDTFENLVTAGRYDWKNDFVTAKRFPVRSSPVGERKLVLLHFGRDISSEAAIAEAEKQGLERPTYEDCLRFGVQHPEVQRQFPIVFLHEPVRGGDGSPCVLCLGRGGSGRGLDYVWFGGGWSDGCRFAFVCK